MYYLLQYIIYIQLYKYILLLQNNTIKTIYNNNDSNTNKKNIYKIRNKIVTIIL